MFQLKYIMRYLSLFLLSILIMSCSQQKSDETLVLATEATYPPFESTTASGELVGLDIDVVHEICEHLKVQCRILNEPWDSLITGVNLGKYNAVFGSMDITEERKKQVLFTQPYYQGLVSYVANKKTHLEITPQGLKGKRIGTQAGSSMEYYIRETYASTVKLKTYDSFQQAFLDLKAKRIDAVIADIPVIQNWLHTENNSENFGLVGGPIHSEKYFKIGIGIAVAKNNQALVDKLNKAIDDMKQDGSLEAITKKYIE